MKTSARALVLVLAVWLAACDTRGTSFSAFQTAPTATPSPAPSGLDAERWSLTTTLTTATGGEACGLTSTSGTSARWLLTLQRHADSRVTVVVADAGDPHHRSDYAGTLAGDVLSVTDGGHRGAMLCGGKRVDMDSESRVSGTIVDFGHLLVGEEVVTARLASGEMLTWRYDWRATFP